MCDNSHHSCGINGLVYILLARNNVSSSPAPPIAKKRDDGSSSSFRVPSIGSETLVKRDGVTAGVLPIGNARRDLPCLLVLDRHLVQAGSYKTTRRHHGSVKDSGWQSLGVDSGLIRALDVSW